MTLKVFSDLLQFKWPYGDHGFHFDIGGKFRGGALDDKSFMAEVKGYRYEMDLTAEYRKFVAESYVALQFKPDRCDNLLWLSWSPFQAKQWHHHRTARKLREHLLHVDNLFRVFGTESVEDAKEKVDEQVLFELSHRI